ncbi:hypothetical protein ACOMHN_033184 [Nucella lapillus]
MEHNKSRLVQQSTPSLSPPDSIYSQTLLSPLPGKTQLQQPQRDRSHTSKEGENETDEEDMRKEYVGGRRGWCWGGWGLGSNEGGREEEEKEDHRERQKKEQ